ncbi:MAG: hypothetical protein V1872_05980 [bacterium]
MRIDAKGIHYKELNRLIKDAFYNDKVDEFVLDGINGQRYIADGLKGRVKIIINGVPGNDLAAFANGPEITVNANGQDAIGNTMNAGKIIIHGHAGDILGHAMRGGEVFVKGDVGYRVGIHMKSYQDMCPTIIAGGCAGDFLGEYMAGGRIIILGLNATEDSELVGKYCGTGLHGGAIYIRGEVEKFKLGKEVGVMAMSPEEEKMIGRYVEEFCGYFGYEKEQVLAKGFTKLFPYSTRPYGKIYAY